MQSLWSTYTYGTALSNVLHSAYLREGSIWHLLDLILITNLSKKHNVFRGSTDNSKPVHVDASLVILYVNNYSRVLWIEAAHIYYVNNFFGHQSHAIVAF